MIDVIQETPVSLFDVARKLGVTTTTVRAWASNRGKRRLETAKVGGKRITSWEAVQRFIEQDDEADDVPPPRLAVVAANHERSMTVLREKYGF